MGSKRRKKAWRIATRVMIAGVIVVPLVLVGLWLAFQHRPDWYRPAELDEAQADRARIEATSTADDLSRRIVHAKPFDVTLTQREVTEWLAVLPVLVPEYQRSVPRELTSPAVDFGDGVIRIAALCDVDGLRSVLSIGVRLSVSDDGRDMEFALTDARIGSLPVPEAALDRLFGAILDEERQFADERVRRGGSSLNDAMRRIDGVADLYEGIKVRNRFVWPNGKRLIRIDSIEIGDGVLRLRIEPL